MIEGQVWATGCALNRNRWYTVTCSDFTVLWGGGGEGYLKLPVSTSLRNDLPSPFWVKEARD